MDWCAFASTNYFYFIESHFWLAQSLVTRCSTSTHPLSRPNIILTNRYYYIHTRYYSSAFRLPFRYLYSLHIIYYYYICCTTLFISIWYLDSNHFLHWLACDSSSYAYDCQFHENASWLENKKITNRPHLTVTFEGIQLYTQRLIYKYDVISDIVCHKRFIRCRDRRHP